MKIEAFMTCTKELVLNAHRHGHEYDESKTITIKYRDVGEALQLTIEDMGTGFDHATMLDKVRTLIQLLPPDSVIRKAAGGLGFR